MFSNLYTNSIYPIPVGEYFGQETDSMYMVYAPLTDHLPVIDREKVEELERIAGKNETGQGGEMSLMLKKLLDTEASGKQMYSVKQIHDYLLLSILPNYKCNFSCSYCFAAKGRSNKEISIEHVKSTLDYFMDNKRTSDRKRFLTFLGGGEPLLSWKIVKYGIEYATTLAAEQDLHLMMELVTNGSILTDDILNTLLHYKVQPRVSFEVLKDIQNKQRGQYAKVCKTIDRLTEAGIHPQVRAMITPDNVERMEEMVQTLVTRFPGVNYYLFDPITDRKIFSEADKTKMFYQKYRQHFFAAADLAQQHGKVLKCAPLQNLNSIVERYCCGELCLTPEGSISICHRIASPSDNDYQRCIYGKFDDSGQLQFNNERFHHLIASYTIYDNSNCENCFVKWNCGGGCMVQHRTYSPDIREVICEFTRDFSKTALLKRINKIQYGIKK